MYDYIIVGGGSAGCVLANRLSASGEHEVCLVEAGPDDTNPCVHMPLGVIPIARGWFCNWQFWSEKEPELGDRATYQPRGKVLGGSSSINAMVCTRGHPSDYDAWAESGCPGWSWDEVLPYFKKSETYTAPLDDVDKPFHGHDGPLHVMERRSTNPLSEAFVEAGQQAGYRLNNDFNGHEQEGIGQYKVFQKDGRRWSNAAAYLPPEVRERKNLTILTDCQVKRVTLEGKRATGVELDCEGRCSSLEARREVILSAGAFQSPQLLMLSGIGPADELQKFGIETQHDLPGVGQNLQDHLEVIIETKAKTRVGSSLHPMTLLRSIKALFQYIFQRKGEFTSNAAEAGGFFKSDPAEAKPDLQWHFGPFHNVYHGLRLGPMLRGWGYIAYIYDLRPKSRGHVTLRDADPMSPPSIRQNYLSEPEDIEKLLKGVKLTREVLKQSAFDPHRDVEISPGPDVQSDDDLRAWIRTAAETTYHPVGTCKMGVDDMAVVDPTLKVHGIENLRVVDASIMPTLNGSNTNAPTTMIAEKAADMIISGTADLN